MPVNAGRAIQADMLSGIEEESDVYAGFQPHVEFSDIVIAESSPGECRVHVHNMNGISDYDA